MSRERQANIRPVETASRPLVGYSEAHPAGFRSGEHSHPRAQLVHAVSGVMRIKTPGSSFIVPPTTALLIPANLQHDILMDGPVEMRSLFLRKSAGIRVGDRPIVITVSTLLRELIVAACAEPLDWDLDGRGHYIAELAVDEIERSKALPMEIILPSDTRLRQITAEILANPSNDQGLEYWADHANVSSRTLTRLFRTETGVSFTQWRQQVRLTGALSALVTGLSPKQAASLACFSSVSAFGVAFRNLFGVTPGQVRSLRKT